MRLCSKSSSCNRIPQLFVYLQSFVIATPGQKILHGQLSKVVPSDMYNCNFEAIN